jgi:hypothetical protein
LTRLTPWKQRLLSVRSPRRSTSRSSNSKGACAGRVRR